MPTSRYGVKKDLTAEGSVFYHEIEDETTGLDNFLHGVSGRKSALTISLQKAMDEDRSVRFVVPYLSPVAAKRAQEMLIPLGLEFLSAGIPGSYGIPAMSQFRKLQAEIPWATTPPIEKAYFLLLLVLMNGAPTDVIKQLQLTYFCRAGIFNKVEQAFGGDADASVVAASSALLYGMEDHPAYNLGLYRRDKRKTGEADSFIEKGFTKEVWDFYVQAIGEESLLTFLRNTASTEYRQWLKRARKGDLLDLMRLPKNAALDLQAEIAGDLLRLYRASGGLSLWESVPSTRSYYYHRGDACYAMRHALARHGLPETDCAPILNQLISLSGRRKRDMYSYMKPEEGVLESAETIALYLLVEQTKDVIASAKIYKDFLTLEETNLDLFCSYVIGWEDHKGMLPSFFVALESE